MNLDSVLTALAGVLDNVSGVTVSPYPPAVLQPPQGFISNVTAVPHDVFEGGWDLTVEVSYLLSLGDLPAAWALASQLMSSATTTSILGVLEADPDLGNTVGSTRLERLTAPTLEQYSEIDYWGVTAVISIYAT